MPGSNWRRQLWLTLAVLCAFTCGGLLLSFGRYGSPGVSLPVAGRRIATSLFDQSSAEDAWPPTPALNLTGGADALVLVHIQKTGGSSFNRQFVRKAGGVRGLPCNCRTRSKRCRCPNAVGGDWLFSRGSTGWACGLHAGLAALRACAPRRFHPGVRLHYLTVLRRPSSRFLSEWRHVRRGATWRAARDFCNGAQVTPAPLCYDGEDWSGVSLEEFAACPSNPARDRQTRMLATGAAACAGGGGEVMLASALDNMRRLAFVGLTEYQVLNQYQLTRGLGLVFNRLFWQRDATVTGLLNVTDAKRSLVESMNRLDERLFAAAEALYFGRVRRLLMADVLADPEVKASLAGLDIAALRAMAPQLEAAAERVLRRLSERDVGVSERRRVRQKVEVGVTM